MADYTAYCYDGADKVWVAETIEAGSDEEAIRGACDLKCIKCEVWQGRRFIAAIEGGQQTGADPQ